MNNNFIKPNQLYRGNYGRYYMMVDGQQYAMNGCIKGVSPYPKQFKHMRYLTGLLVPISNPKVEKTFEDFHAKHVAEMLAKTKTITKSDDFDGYWG